MPLGPGRYDDVCTEIRERFHAVGVILIVIQGDRGEGFEAQLPLELLLKTPDTLEAIAAQMRALHATGEV